MTKVPRRVTYHVGRRLVGGVQRRLPSSVTRRLDPTRARLARKVTSRSDVTDDLRSWSEARGLDVIELSPEEFRSRQLPTPLLGEPHPNFERHRVGHLLERFLVCVPRAKLWGKNGVVVLPDGSLSAQSIYGRAHLELDWAYRTPLPLRSEQIDGDCFTLIGEFSNSGNHYHWMHDALLRMHGVRAHLPSNTRFVVPSGLRPHQRETLHLLGLNDDQLIELSGQRPLECERLWFASLPPAGAAFADAVTWLQRALWSAAGIERATPARRLYLSRRAAKHARILNEPEIEATLDRHDFEIVQPELMSVAEQIRLFAEAAAIVSPTSAGQANLLFASNETRNLEILEPRWAERKAYVVWSLAETLGQRYSYLMAETTPVQDGHGRYHMSVSPQRLDAALTQLLDDSTWSRT